MQSRLHTRGATCEAHGDDVSGASDDQSDQRGRPYPVTSIDAIEAPHSRSNLRGSRRRRGVGRRSSIRSERSSLSDHLRPEGRGSHPGEQSPDPRRRRRGNQDHRSDQRGRRLNGHPGRVGPPSRPRSRKAAGFAEAKRTQMMRMPFSVDEVALREPPGARSTHT